LGGVLGDPPCLRGYQDNLFEEEEGMLISATTYISFFDMNITFDAHLPSFQRPYVSNESAGHDIRLLLLTQPIHHGTTANTKDAFTSSFSAASPRAAKKHSTRQEIPLPPNLLYLHFRQSVAFRMPDLQLLDFVLDGIPGFTFPR
jgi:hypothetical protein